ncbi:small ribosomal subunit protein uS7m-like [Glandiceps talaboti]
MALTRCFSVCRTVIVNNCHEAAVFSFPLAQQVRYARYPKTYVDPVVDKEAYRKEGSLPYDISVPIKAAKNDMSSSVFNDPVISKFTNLTMMKGGKELARELFRETLEQVKRIQLEKYHKATEEEKANLETNPRVIFHTALENCKPVVGLTSINRGGRSYQVPVPLKENRRRFLAMRWLLDEARNKPKPRLTHLPERLSKEILLAYNNEGKVIQKKLELHKQADSNKAYAHYRWW